MKKLLSFAFSFAFSFLMTGCSAGPNLEEELETTESAEIAEEEVVEESGPCKMIGTWEVSIPGDEGTIITTGVFNADGTDTGDFCVGTADSISATIVTPQLTQTTPLSEDFGLYEMDGDNVTVKAVNQSTTFTGTFTDDTHVTGTWVHHTRGTSGTFIGEKISN